MNVGDRTMGSYRGGSTIITRGQFGSFDPADNTGYSSTSKTKSTVTKKKLSIRKNKHMSNTQLLENIIDQILSDPNHIKIPRKVAPSLRAKIDSVGGPTVWAGQQQNFQKLKDQKLKRKQKKQLDRMANETLASEPLAPMRENERDTSPSTNPLKKQNVTSDQITNDEINNLMGSLIDQKLSGVTNLIIPIGNTPVLNEARKAETPQQWLEAQIGYTEMLSRLSKFKKTYVSQKKIEKKATLDPVIPREDSSKLTSQDINSRGLKIIKIHPTCKINRDFLIQVAGILPPTPMLLAANTRVRGKKKKLLHNEKLLKLWLELMDKEQKRAWNKLSKKKQTQYFKTGRLRVGFPTKVESKSKPSIRVKTLAPRKASKSLAQKTIKQKSSVQTLSDGPIDHVLIKLDAPQTETWYKKQDWSIT